MRHLKGGKPRHLTPTKSTSLYVRGSTGRDVCPVICILAHEISTHPNRDKPTGYQSNTWRPNPLPWLLKLLSFIRLSIFRLKTWYLYFLFWKTYSAHKISTHPNMDKSTGYHTDSHVKYPDSDVLNVFFPSKYDVYSRGVVSGKTSAHENSTHPCRG